MKGSEGKSSTYTLRPQLSVGHFASADPSDRIMQHETQEVGADKGRRGGGEVKRPSLLATAVCIVANFPRERKVRLLPKFVE